MLQALRRSLSSIVVKALFALLVASFALWGLDGILGSSPAGRAVATVGGAQVSQQDFIAALRTEESALRQRGIDPAALGERALADSVLAGLVNRALYEAEGARVGFAVPDSVVSRTIQDTPGLRDGAGAFSRQQYEFFVAAQGLTPQGYEARLRRELVAYFLADVLEAGAAPPRALRDAMRRHAAETRDAIVISAPAVAADAIPAPGGDALEAWHTENGELFREPARRAVTYLHVDVDALAAAVTVDAARLRALYEEQIDNYTRAERRDVWQMILPDAGAAAEAAEALAAGEDFAAVGARLAGQTADAMRLGWLERAAIPDPALAEVAFSLDAEEVSAPAEGLVGWFIARAADVQPARVTPLEAVADDLRARTAREDAIEQAWALADEMDSRVGAGVPLEDVGEALGLPLRRATIDADGRDASGAAASLPGDGAGFAAAAFETPEGLESLMEDDGADGFYVLRVDAVTDSHIPALDDVRDRAARMWRAWTAREGARTRARDVADRINGGSPPDLAAMAAGLSPRTVAAVNRAGLSFGPAFGTDGGAPALSAAQAETLFGLDWGAAGVAPMPPISPVIDGGGGGWSVVVAAGPGAPPPPLSPEALERLEETLRADITADLTAQFLALLRGRHDVSVNRAAMDHLLSGPATP